MFMLLLTISYLHVAIKTKPDDEPDRVSLHQRVCAILKRVLEADLSLDRVLESATINLLVHDGEVDGRAGDKDEDEELQASRDPETSKIAWSFGLPAITRLAKFSRQFLGGDSLEHGGTKDTTNATESDLQSRANRALGLVANVVGLICKNGRDVALAAGIAEEETEVASKIALSICSHHQTTNSKARLERNGRRTDLVLVRQPRDEERADDCEDDWWSGQQMSDTNGVAHTEDDDRTEVGESVCRHSSRHEHERESPELEVLEVEEELAHGQRIWDRVTTIALDTLCNECCLLLGQETLVTELALASGLVWEVLDDEPGADCNGDRQKTFNDEDPLPAVHTAKAIHLDQTVCEDGRPAADKDGDQIEPGETLLHFESDVPARDQVDAAWEETSLKQTEQETAGCKCLVALDETLAHHNDAP